MAAETEVQIENAGETSKEPTQAEVILGNPEDPKSGAEVSLETPEDPKEN